MDNFDKAENKGRALLESFLNQANITDWQPTTDKYDGVDGYFTHNGKKTVAEIKVRNIMYLDYPTHYLELIKYNHMIDILNEGGATVGFYCNFFGDDILYIYNILNAADCEISWEWCKKTSAADNGETYKQMINIPTVKALKFKRVDGIWKKI